MKNASDPCAIKLCSSPPALHFSVSSSLVFALWPKTKLVPYTYLLSCIFSWSLSCPYKVLLTSSKLRANSFSLLPNHNFDLLSTPGSASHATFYNLHHTLNFLMKMLSVHLVNFMFFLPAPSLSSVGSSLSHYHLCIQNLFQFSFLMRHTQKQDTKTLFSS